MAASATATTKAAAPQYLTGDAQAISAFIDKFDTFLFDCDGVLWSGDHVFPGTQQVLAHLRAQGKRLVFVTNNSTKSRAAYKAKFDTLTIPVQVSEIFGSSYSAAVYIAHILRQPRTAKIFVLGEAGVEDELRALDLAFVGGTDPALRRDLDPATDFAAIASGAALDPAVNIVLAGLDFHVNYLKLALAHQYLLRGARFLATNADSTLPNAHSLFPGAGAISAPLERASGRAPTCFGKPSPAMMDAITGAYQLDKARTCMVGDRLNTDIAFGIDGGLGGTLAVLTGVSTKEEFLAQGAEVVPSAYVDKLGDLLAE